MELWHMKNELGRISRVYNRPYHQEVMDIFWDKFSSLNPNRFRDITTRVIETARCFPTIQDFEKINIELKTKQYFAEKKQTSDEINELYPKASTSLYSQIIAEVKRGIKDKKIYPLDHLIN